MTVATAPDATTRVQTSVSVQSDVSTDTHPAAFDRFTALLSMLTRIDLREIAAKPGAASGDPEMVDQLTGFVSQLQGYVALAGKFSTGNGEICAPDFAEPRDNVPADLLELERTAAAARQQTDSFERELSNQMRRVDSDRATEALKRFQGRIGINQRTAELLAEFMEAAGAEEQKLNEIEAALQNRLAEQERAAKANR